VLSVVCFLIFVALIIDAIPLWFFWHLISARARLWRVKSVWYFCFAGVGSVLGLVSTYAALFVLFVSATKTADVNDWIVFFSFLLGGLVGASIAPAASYLVLRMRTSSNPDYGPLDSSEE
jgi:hypothetical protein